MEDKKHMMPKHPTREQVASALRRCLEHDANNIVEYYVEANSDDGTVKTTIVLVEQSS
ncbi:MAG TPA: hypothetical protein VFZ00_11130 [Solirubrobacter sp.]|nr:hypothetical protein [Solirubrobacter sp.]